MSEELIQTVPQQIGRYTYLRLGNTTLEQLKNHGHIPKRNYGALKTKKPDGLVLLHGAVKAVVEYKQAKELASPRLIAKAIAQELEVARALCKILIVTDGTKTFWVNALVGDRIHDASGNELRVLFHPFVVQKTATIEFLLDEIDASITPHSSNIRVPKLIDPTPLATRLWQTIWVATGKSPVKCLYNVVELFIFKFLSDLKILPDDVSFSHIYQKARANPEDALDYYARNTRVRIYRLFPGGADGTTIINGTIFVNETGNANLSQAFLFQRCLEHLQKYSEEFGSLTQIDKQFKTRLYESFLKQEVEALGQYFTPRRIVQAVIRMAGIDQPTFSFQGKRICDPFCGVGGFPLETLNLNEAMRECYRPDARKRIDVPFVLHGFDKGFERDDERTIILAKANMLIYLAELLFANPDCTQQFANAFNQTFQLFKDNLGTFGHIIHDESDKYDIILSNPPYVTRGSSIIKDELKRTPRTVNEYPINALGLEGLSIEWIIRSLRRGGRAFLIIPDGILARQGAGRKLRNYILEECFLDAIVSLPRRAFFANEKQTYILAITKKQNETDVQRDPVFTYLISDIGERLTSVRREEIDNDDLPLMEGSFQVFHGAKAHAKPLLEQRSGRCKIQEISVFRESPHWVIDRWWTRHERITAGIDESLRVATKSDIDSLLATFNELLAEYEALRQIALKEPTNARDVALGDTGAFRMFIGDRVLRSERVPTGVPVYSANVFKPFGFIEQSNVDDPSVPTILWGIDGNFDLRLLPIGEPFATTDHCGALQILDHALVPAYVLYAMTARREAETFTRSFRASLENMRRFTISIPVSRNGGFDVQTQRLYAARFTELEKKALELRNLKMQLDANFKRYVF